MTLPDFSNGFQKFVARRAASHSARVKTFEPPRTSRVAMLPEASSSTAICGDSLRSMRRTSSGRNSVKTSSVMMTSRSASMNTAVFPPRRVAFCQHSQAAPVHTAAPSRMSHGEEAKDQVVKPQPPR